MDNTEVKKHRAKKVLGWVANWEIMVLLAWVRILVLLRGEWTVLKTGSKQW